MGRLTAAQTDRACGVLLTAPCGDALGAGYEFAPVAADLVPQMVGGGLGDFAPGEWTDDTAQAVAIAEVAAIGHDLRSAEALDAIARRFADWYAADPADVGLQTAAVLAGAGRHPTGAAMADAARVVHARTGRSAGNGSLMRTGAVALAFLDDPARLVEAAMAVSALTHYEDLAQQGCAVWCLMIRHAVLHGEFPTFDDIRGHVPNADYWAAVLTEAEAGEPGTFTANAWVVGRYKRRGRPYSTPRSRRGCRGVISAMPSPQPSGSATTPTPSPPSPGPCSAPAGVSAPFRPRGGGRSTAGPAGAGRNWWSSPT